jgi:ribonucleoside-triphosphate reductase (formate)
MSQSTALSFPFRPISAGMGQAVAERTILRRKENGEFEDWGDVASRVARGNASLFDGPIHSSESEYLLLRKHIANGNTLMSGRHLQHGDELQSTRNMEVFTNCATSSASFLLFYLLLNGSGVGRCYDDDMILVNWDHAPNLRCVLDSNHPDFNYSAHESVRDARHKYGNDGPNVMWYEVPDSREGWAKALEIWENAAFEKIHAEKMLILDFSKVRAKGSPIHGMQNRPASGPVALMDAFEKAAKLKGAGLSPWKQAIYLDHYFAECVLVGGARRAARMSTKHWSDPTVFEFITIKRPLEFHGKNVPEILAYRQTDSPSPFLWSSNNSVTVDDEFWALVKNPKDKSPRAKHAKKVFKTVCSAAYADGTGEPGFINSHMLVQKDEGWQDLNRGDYVGSKKYQLNDDTQILMSRLAKRAKKKKYHTITNPCGEIALNVLGGFCVIADVVPYHCETLEEAEECFRVVTRALMRVNLMDSVYSKEVQRTNRIGVGLTGVHEFAYKFFGYGFRDLVDEEKSKNFWMQMAKFNRIVHEEATSYAKELGVKAPHTETTIKPAGTTSKLFLLTEGWHLPSMKYFLRWVQFRHDDPLVKEYHKAGYPTRQLVHYTGTTIVGFPTEPTITTLGMEDKLITAAEATPEEQFKWLMLGEKYWIRGVTEEGKPVEDAYGNQISYTLKYKPDAVDYEHFKKMILKYQSQVRCCSVMPQEDTSSYEYQPEQPISAHEFMSIVEKVKKAKKLTEEIGREHVGCDNGACPVDFNSGRK